MPYSDPLNGHLDRIKYIYIQTIPMYLSQHLLAACMHVCINYIKKGLNKEEKHSCQGVIAKRGCRKRKTPNKQTRPEEKTLRQLLFTQTFFSFPSEMFILPLRELTCAA